MVKYSIKVTFFLEIVWWCSFKVVSLQSKTRNKKFNNKKRYDNETEFRIYNKADKR